MIVSELRKSAVEILNKHASDLKGRQAFKPEEKMLALWAADCAEHVLPYFEEKHHNDDRLRRAIEACRAWVATGVFRMADVRKVSLNSHAAAREEKEVDAVAFARAAGHAIASAHVATHAFGAAAYTIKAAAVYADNVKKAITKERDW